MLEGIILVYACVASLIGPGLQANAYMNKQVADIRSGAVAPIVIPEQAHMGSFRDDSIKVCKEWVKAHPDQKESCQ